MPKTALKGIENLMFILPQPTERSSTIGFPFQGIRVALRLPFPKKPTLFQTTKRGWYDGGISHWETRNYTVMSTHHLRNTGLSLKSKGLFFMMLSLPEDWNYTAKAWSKSARRAQTASAPGQQGQDRGCGACHLRDVPSPGHGPVVWGWAGYGLPRYGKPGYE